ncbi:hypothetical protein [Thalassovita sp.]|uniref:hypothetical protein n=1 Tax=Thalassovita sp. TaxID=1979401 RepID=UPI002B27B95B|nr:hypothetical protein [Thalassovita sp.]
MADTFREFDKRLSRIDRKRSRMKRGYVTVVGRDGLIVTKPRRARRRLPLRGILLLVLGFVGFKAILLAHLGFGIYQDRVESLQGGGLVEQAGAIVMAPDPVSEFMAIRLRPYLK